MDTPICDFVRRYVASDTVRLHMPGHKGQTVLGCESLDITEISGADSLYEADGVIRDSERNASSIFGCPTYYSTEGSSLCIRAMLYLVCLHAKERGVERPLIVAGRNAHKTFLSAAALLDLDVEWLYPDETYSYLACTVTLEAMERVLTSERRPDAVYLTSPDYLGNVADIEAIAALCHRHGVLLLVDNAHGAYLKFLPSSIHPIDLGADLVCDSAHKTLPVLTGGAYLHVSPRVSDVFPTDTVKDALALFGSTSPSYLILQSLDAVNPLLTDPDYIAELVSLSCRVEACREQLTSHGINARVGDEPLKLTLYPRFYGYAGDELAALLREGGIECEFSDPDFVVMMLSPATSDGDIEKLSTVLLSIPRREIKLPPTFKMTHPMRAMSIREATLSPRESLPIEHCLGRVLASPSVGCPPAVPIVVSGEIIDENALAAFAYYGIESCTVVKC